MSMEDNVIGSEVFPTGTQGTSVFQKAQNVVLAEAGYHVELWMTPAGFIFQVTPAQVEVAIVGRQMKQVSEILSVLPESVDKVNTVTGYNAEDGTFVVEGFFNYDDEEGTLNNETP